MMPEDSNTAVPGQDGYRLDLLSASLVADVIRRRVSESQTGLSGDPIDEQQYQRHSFRFPVPPGVVEGVAGALLVGGLSLPIRNKLLKIAGPRLHVLTELIVTPLQVMGAFQVGLYLCSLYGSSHYLQRLAEIPARAPSATVDAICRDETVYGLWRSSRSDSDIHRDTNEGHHLPSMDPRHRCVKLLEQALTRCRERHEYQQEQNMLASGTESMNQEKEFS